MILVRDVFQAKYGKGDELVALFKEGRQQMFQDAHFEILTDASGPFFTIVTESRVENLATWERSFDKELSLPGFDDWFARMVPLVDSGRREFYRVEE